MLKRMKKNQKGFTLAELLIVVAIIGVLVAISIPVFTAQLRKSRLATNQANARSAYAIATAQFLDENDGTVTGSKVYKYDVKKGELEVVTAASGSNPAVYYNTTALTNPATSSVISDWTVESLYDGSQKAGDSVATVWEVEFKDGAYAAIKGTK